VGAAALVDQIARSRNFDKQLGYLVSILGFNSIQAALQAQRLLAQRSRAGKRNSNVSTFAQCIFDSYFRSSNVWSCSAWAHCQQPQQSEG
jgi:hypothetical protein